MSPHHVDAARIAEETTISLVAVLAEWGEVERRSDEEIARIAVVGEQEAIAVEAEAIAWADQSEGSLHALSAPTARVSNAFFTVGGSGMPLGPPERRWVPRSGAAAHLRATLSKAGLDSPRVMGGVPPETFEEAVAEWNALLPRVESSVTHYAARRGRRRKGPRDGSDRDAPTLEFWRELARIELLHSLFADLRAEYIAMRVDSISTATSDLIEEVRQRADDERARVAGRVNELKDALAGATGGAGLPWSDSWWQHPEPSRVIEPILRLGELEVAHESVPVVTSFPGSRGLAVSSDDPSRQRAIGFLRGVMLRALAAVPAGGVHIKVIDPIALGQSAAVFRQLSDYDSQIIGERTHTSERDIETVLDDLAAHLELVISTYLRGQFDTIDDYNAHAGEVAQAYRLLVVFDFPHGFSERATRRLLSLIENGARCGVTVFLHHSADDLEQTAPGTPSLRRLTDAMLRVGMNGDGAVLHVEEDADIPFRPDQAPPLAFDRDGEPVTPHSRLLPSVGAVVKRALERPRSVTLDSLLPVLARSRSGALPDYRAGSAPLSADSATWWQASTAREAVAPLGRSGAQSVASIVFSSTEVAGGAIMVGVPRSGKTTSLHSMILTMALLYSPEELELYLIDAKYGVEFQAYRRLPHARVVAIRTDREYSLSVLQSLESIVRDRAELMKSDGGGATNLTEFRSATGRVLPRIVVVIDEFHELFERDDRIGLDAFAAFSNLVRMGPFAGVHIVVATQTLSGMSAMDMQTLMLLPHRIAFQCNEYDAELLMGEGSRAARGITKVGEGLLNPSRGRGSEEQVFQGLLVSTEERTAVLEALEQKAEAAGWNRVPRVFDGAAAARRPAAEDVDRTRFSIPVGEPFGLDARLSVMLRRSQGANVLVLGDASSDGDPAVLGVVHSAILAARERDLEVAVLDFADGDGSTLRDLAVTLGARHVDGADAGPFLALIEQTVAERHASGDADDAAKLLVVVGLERALAWEGAGDDTGPAVRLSSLLRGGPEVGVHTLVTVDRGATLERRLGGDAWREFVYHVWGSVVDVRDLEKVGVDAPTPAPGQLLVVDGATGAVRRATGYGPLEPEQIAFSAPPSVAGLRRRDRRRRNPAE